MNKVLFLSLVSAIVALSSCGRNEPPPDPCAGPNAADPACNPGAYPPPGAQGNPQGGDQQQGGQQQGQQRQEYGYNPNAGGDTASRGSRENATSVSGSVACEGQYEPITPTDAVDSEQYNKKYVWCLREAKPGEANYCQGLYYNVEKNTKVNCAG